VAACVGAPAAAYGHRRHRTCTAGAPEPGSELETERESTTRKARLLEQRTHADAVAVAKDGRAGADIAREVVAASGRIGQDSVVRP
jgi:hypothetical protein